MFRHLRETRRTLRSRRRSRVRRRDLVIAGDAGWSAASCWVSPVGAPLQASPQVAPETGPSTRRAGSLCHRGIAFFVDYVVGERLGWQEAERRRQPRKALHLEAERGNERGQRPFRGLGFTDHDRYLMTRWID